MNAIFKLEQSQPQREDRREGCLKAHRRPSLSLETGENRPQIPDPETDYSLYQVGLPQVYSAAASDVQSSEHCGPEENIANWRWVPRNDTAPWPWAPWPGCREHPQDTGSTFQVLFNWTEGQNTGTGSRPPGDTGLLAATQTVQRTD